MTIRRRRSNLVCVAFFGIIALSSFGCPPIIAYAVVAPISSSSSSSSSSCSSTSSSSLSLSAAGPITTATITPITTITPTTTIRPEQQQPLPRLPPTPPSEAAENKEDSSINNNRSKNDNFYIHGWRWHTQVLGRDARRLAQLAAYVATTISIVVNNDTTNNDNNSTADHDDDDQQEQPSLSLSLQLSDLQKATEYTVNFNMKALHRIERQVFFPWVRNVVVPAIMMQRIPSEPQQQTEKNNNDRTSTGTTTITAGTGVRPPSTMSTLSSSSSLLRKQELITAMDRLEQYQSQLHELGQALLVVQSSLILPPSSSSSGLAPSRRRRGGNGTMATGGEEIVTSTSSSSSASLVSSLATMVKLANEISRTVQLMREQVQEPIVVPMIADTVSSTDQSALNQLVIRHLGVLDSRIHLVAMYETIVEESPHELIIFHRMIPSWTRRFIPRWKRLLYEPRIGNVLYNNNNNNTTTSTTTTQQQRRRR